MESLGYILMYFVQVTTSLKLSCSQIPKWSQTKSVDNTYPISNQFPGYSPLAGPACCNQAAKVRKQQKTLFSNSKCETLSSTVELR